MFPDVDRINPEYFRYVDRKIDYLNEHGFVPFIEVSRRDASLCWKKYYPWPDSYARFIQYVWSRYQANNTVLSPVHLDIISETVGPEDFMAGDPRGDGEVRAAAFRHAAFVQCQSVDARELGRGFLGDAAPDRQHARAQQLLVSDRDLQRGPTAAGAERRALLLRATWTRAALGAGRLQVRRARRDREGRSVRALRHVRQFSFGRVAGHVYGAEGIWGADIEPAAPIKMWDAFQWNSGSQMQYLRTFALSIGKRYQELVPIADLVSPNKTPVIRGYEGWAYCARTPDKEHLPGVLREGLPAQPDSRRAAATASTARSGSIRATGTWQDAGSGTLPSNQIGIINLPDFPGDTDWGLRLTYMGPAAQR